MIPSDLLRYKLDYKSNKIYPNICSLDKNSKDFEIATQIIQAFGYCHNLKLTREKLNHSLKDIESTYKDYKLIRGLSAILERRCIFRPISQVQSIDSHNINYDNEKQKTELFRNLSAIDIRRFIFDESSKQNIALNERTRESILREVSNTLRISNEIISKMMWSDLEENQIMDTFIPLNSEHLLLTYNISLIQTLLFNCLRVRIWLDADSNLGALWKQVLREVKRLGLMYWLDLEDSSNDVDKKNKIICTVEGALNVLKLTDRYGIAISKILPIIMRSKRWNIKADIFKVTNSGKKLIYEFDISEKSYPDSLPSSHIIKMYTNPAIYYNNEINKNPLLINKNSLRERYNNNKDENSDIQNIGVVYNIDNDNTSMLFDSKIERIFLQRFELLKLGWTIEREPEPIITKQKTAFVPDFILSKFGNKVFVEIIGFWTKEYLERKISKIFGIIQNKMHDEKFFMILVINFENMMSYEINEEFKLANIKNNSNVLITSYRNEKISFKEIIVFLKDIESNYLIHDFLNENTQNKILENIIERLKEFRNYEENYMTLEKLNEMLKKNDSEDALLKVNLTDLLNKNTDFKTIFEKELLNNQLIIINDSIFKRQFIEEIEKETESITNLKEACDLLSSKKISEKIHIDLLTFLGFHIDWNGLDYSRATITLVRNKSFKQ